MHDWPASSAPTPIARGARFRAGSEPGQLCAATAQRLRRRAHPPHPVPAIPADIGRPRGHRVHAGRSRPCAARPDREAPEAARRVVTVSPDVSSSTNLGGWINKVGVWSAAERTRLVRRRRRNGAALAGEADRPAHRARHRRDQPGRPARRAGRDLEPVGAAAAADRRAVRPVRRTRAGALVVRHLRGRPVDPGRHPFGRDARAGGRRSPVDHHAVHRARAAGLRQLRARLRHRRGMDAARLPGPAGPTRRRARRTSGCPPAPSTRPWPRCRADPAARERRRRHVVAGAYRLRRTPGLRR